jgi:hypothetical protein
VLIGYVGENRRPDWRRNDGSLVPARDIGIRDVVPVEEEAVPRAYEALLLSPIRPTVDGMGRVEELTGALRVYREARLNLLRAIGIPTSNREPLSEFAEQWEM